MRRIKRISHLQLEKEQLAHRRADLERDINRDWDHLRHRFEPAGLARDAFFSGLTWIGRRLFPTEEHKHHSYR